VSGLDARIQPSKAREVRKVKASERRQAIIEALNERRQDKVCNLAFEFGVSERTIRRDLIDLSFSYPIYTKAGKEDGGVYVEKDFHLYKRCLNSDEREVLIRTAAKTTDSLDKEMLLAILRRFS
jgi:DeoR/GlpR family transcriptional regulator of sugar metabolism